MLDVKKELHKSFRDADMETVWKLHDKLSHRDQWTYNQMIAVAAKGGFVKKAFSIFQKMKKIPIQPTMGTYHWLLQACANGKEKDGQYVARAFYVVELMEEAKLQLNLHSYNLLLQICANANDIELAAEVLRKMSSSGIAADVSSFSSLLNCTRGGSIESIQQVWSELKTKFSPDTRAWNTYLNVLKESNFHKEAIAAYKEMIVTPIASEYDPEGEKVLPIPSPYTLSLLLDSCAENKDFAEGRQIFLRALTDEKWRKEIKFDEVLLQSMLRIAARLKANMVFAVEGLNNERKLPISKATRELYIMAYGRTGDLKGCMRHFEAARLAAELNLRCFTGLLIGCRTAKDADRAYLSFEVLQRCNIRPDQVYVKLLREILVSNGRVDLLKKLDAGLAGVQLKGEKKNTQPVEEKLQQAEPSTEEAVEEEYDEVEEPSEKTHRFSGERLDVPEQKKYYGTAQQYKAKSHQRRNQYEDETSFDTPTVRSPRVSTTLPPNMGEAPTRPEVILPSNEPSASRSVFFAAQRLQQTRSKGEGTL